MSQFDPVQKREWWLFQQVGNDPFDRHKPIWKCLRYCLVSYDGDPQRWIEPSSNEEIVNTISTSVSTGTGGASGAHKVLKAIEDGQGLIAGIEYFTKRPYEVHAFDDVDAATNLGQLP